MPGEARVIHIGQPNLDHRHLYLTGCMDLFPEDVLGGPNKSHAAARTVRVEYGHESVETDVVRGKRIFRRRKWVREFFTRTGMADGDRVLLEQLDPYSYRVTRLES